MGMLLYTLQVESGFTIFYAGVTFRTYFGTVMPKGGTLTKLTRANLEISNFAFLNSNAN